MSSNLDIDFEIVQMKNNSHTILMTEYKGVYYTNIKVGLYEGKILDRIISKDFIQQINNGNIDITIDDIVVQLIADYSTLPELNRLRSATNKILRIIGQNDEKEITELVHALFPLRVDNNEEMEILRSIVNNISDLKKIRD